MVRIRRGWRMVWWAPGGVAIALFSRRRLLRWTLTLVYYLVVTPLALWQRWRPGSALRNWRRPAARPGWRPLNVSSHDRSLYRTEA